MIYLKTIKLNRRLLNGSRLWFHENIYECIKDAGCEKCGAHTQQLVMSSQRSSNNMVYFCPTPEIKINKRASSAADRGKVRRG